MDNYEMSGAESASKYRNQFQHELQRFGLEVHDLKVTIVSDTDEQLTLKVNYSSDSVMDRGLVEADEFTATFLKPLYSEDYMVPEED